LSESQQRWQERVSLVPGAVQRQLLKSYRGLSPALVRSLVQAAGLNPDQSTESLNASDWQHLFQRWQEWLQVISNRQDDKGESAFQPGWTDQGYTVLGWGVIKPAKNVQTLINDYYTTELNQQDFTQLRHQLTQKLGNVLEKLRQKASTFEERLQQSDQADEHRQQADLLMAHLQSWEPGMKSITLLDFETSKPADDSLESREECCPKCPSALQASPEAQTRSECG
jgi:predicted ribosome quality control (RQC) complex YloA/Tae2 family protein